MSASGQNAPARVRWARLRFAIIGPLLAAPPKSGELWRRLEELSEKWWQHPSSGEPVQFSVPTLERWYYLARNEPRDPIVALERKVRGDAGRQRSVGPKLGRAIEQQHRQHKRWSYRLHYDNLVALAETDPDLGELPSCTTVRRFMKSQGLVKLPRKRRRRGEHDEPAAPHVPREMRSFEVEHVHALWHSDYHEGSRKVITPHAEWVTPQLFGMLDDCSRVACHLQWYYQESSETFAHGFSQGVQKRGLPRALLTDNGGAMTAAEIEQGLERLSIKHYTTLPYTPEQNAKQEAFWVQVEGRLMPMLENVAELTLELLNHATCAWVELEYNHRVHSELGVPPIERMLAVPSLGRPSPSSNELRRAFRREETRTQRRSDGTISVLGKRFELPSRYRTLQRPTIRLARWDLSTVDLVDPHTGKVLCSLLPQDKHKNASGRRRALEPVAEPVEAETDGEIAPLLQKLMADYAATGLPPAYLPLTHDTDSEDPDNE